MKLPPEWHPQSCVWVSPPHAVDTWPGCLAEAQAQFATFMDLIARTTPVRTLSSLGIATDDSWVRDYGPIFVHDDRGKLHAHDFRFNNWGGKYGPCPNDADAAARLIEHLGIPFTHHDEFILEGGSIDIAGDGTLLTTEQCLLNPQRNAKLSKPQIEAKLAETLGVSRIVWLPGGIAGDDTDGHIDDVARFLDDGLTACVSPPQDHPDHDVMQRNLAALRGAKLEVIELPAPQPVWFDDPNEGRRMLPCSYANFLLSNGQILVPVFGQTSDDVALRLLDDAREGWRVTPVRAEVLVVGYGALHCLTMQQPESRQ